MFLVVEGEGDYIDVAWEKSRDRKRGGKGQTKFFHKKKSFESFFIFPPKVPTQGMKFFILQIQQPSFPRISEKRKKICGCYPGPSFYLIFSQRALPPGGGWGKAG